MGKPATNSPAEQEVTKLQTQLHQSAQDTSAYLEALKRSLNEFDHKYHLHHASSASWFFVDGLDHAKDAVKELRHIVDHIRKNADSAEVATVARRAMEQTFNALADLHKVAHAYDSEHPRPNKYSTKKPTVSETVEWVVSTTRDASFTGLAPLQRQIVQVQIATGEIEKTSITSRAKEAVHHVADRIDSKLHKSSPRGKEKQQTEATTRST